MGIQVSIRANRLESTLVRWAAIMRKDVRASMMEAGRRVTRMVIDITPPASSGATGRDAYMQGKRKIRRNLTQIMAPRTLKHQRVERFPDIEATYRRRAVWRNNGVGVRVGRGALAYVDRAKFLAFEKGKLEKIGRMASGWLAGAQLFKLSTLQWISRHGSGRGYAVMLERAGEIGWSVGNFAPSVPPNVVKEMERRIPFAMAYVQRGLEDNITHVGRKSAGAAGLNVRF